MTTSYDKVWKTLKVAPGIIKCDRKLLQSVTGITKCDKKLLQRVSGITKCDSFFQSGTASYDKVCQMLQFATGITKCDRTLLQIVVGIITKCDNYYKVRRNTSTTCYVTCVFHSCIFT